MVRTGAETPHPAPPGSCRWNRIKVVSHLPVYDREAVGMPRSAPGATGIPGRTRPRLQGPSPSPDKHPHHGGVAGGCEAGHRRGRLQVHSVSSMYGSSPSDRDGLTMKHTVHADYALRVLMYLRVAPGRRGSIAEIAAAYHISRNHLDKVVKRMGVAGLVQTSRGRGGGVRLVLDPSAITMGDVMRAMEDDFAVVECLGPARFCRIAGVCGARSVFAKALDSYFTVLDGATLDDMAANDQGLRGALDLISHAGP